jgi:hypothetical protein
MAIVPQQRLFRWHEIEQLQDLERLRLVLEHMPDEALMKRLEKERANGRDDYPVRGVWNCILARIVYQHTSVESLRRELLRNAQLRWECGLDGGVPPSWVFSRFMKKLMKLEHEVQALFEQLVQALALEMPDLGESLAIDGKAIWSHGKPANKGAAADGRRETDADWGAKTYRGVRPDGTAWEKTQWYFGFKLHLVVDANYELPVAYRVSRASQAEAPQARQMLDEMERRQPWLLERCQMLLADKGYDDGKLLGRLWDEHAIKPVIAIRDLWKDGEATRLLEGKDNVVYDYCGNVYCHCPVEGNRRSMAYGSFEKKRKALKYRCPARHYGIECKGSESCAASGGIRVPLEVDRRIFVPIARSSYKWQREYKKRTAVERVNSRLDVSFGFENHFIRGLRKMAVRCGLALGVMLAMALGRVKTKRKALMRSLVAA